MVLGAIFARHFVKATAATHVALTGASLGFGIFGPATTLGSTMDASENKRQREDDDSASSKLDSRAEVMLRSGLDTLILEMYSGRGIDPQYQFEHKNLVALDKHVSFEDAAVVCTGAQEVTEAFRAVKEVGVEALSSPRCVQIDKKDGGDWVVTYALHQRYAGRLTFNSILVVHASVGDPVEDENHHAAIRVKRMQEQWNGIEPQGGIYWPSRRLNGILSYGLTALLV